MNEQEQKDVASLLIRIMQINLERPGMTSVHWLWDRIMSCDVLRLRRQLTDPKIRKLFEETVEEMHNR